MSQFPPPPPTPPHEGFGGYGGYGMPAYDVIEAIKYGWRKFSQNAGAFVVLGLLAFLVPIAIQVVGEIARGGGGLAADEMSDSNPGLGFAMVASGGLVGFLLSVVSNIVAIFFNAALVRAALDATEGQPVSLSAAFTRWNKLQVVLLAIVVGLLTAVGIVLCVLPGIAVMFFTWFATFFVVVGMPAIAAIGASFRFTADHIGNMLLLMLMCVLILIAGFCACGVGLLVAAPVAMVAAAYTFKVLQEEPVAP